MKKTIKTLLAGLLIVPALALGVSLSTPLSQTVSAAETITKIQAGANAAQGDSSTTCLFANDTNCSDGGVFTTIVNVALYIIGALSVIMLIYGGIRYTVSMGDAKNVEAAKNTIMYAIIGIVVALLAYAIVNFVIGSLA